MAQFDSFDRVPNEWRELIVVDAALACGLIDALADEAKGQRSAGALAKELALDARATVAVLDALVDLGYAACGPDGYGLTDPSRAFLVDEQDPRYRRHALAHSAHQLRRWVQLAEVLRAGGPAPAVEEYDLERFVRAMDDSSRPQAAAVVDALLDAAPDARTVLDAGGGPGSYARELARRGVATTVLDRPDVVAMVAPWFAAEPLVTYVAGDMTQALPPGSFDIVLVANVIHSYGPAQNEALVRRAAGVVASRGVLAIFDFLLGISPRAPLFAVNMLISTAEGRCYREDEVRGWCEAAGLTVQPAIDFVGRDEQLVLAWKELGR